MFLFESGNEYIKLRVRNDDTDDYASMLQCQVSGNYSLKRMRYAKTGIETFRYIKKVLTCHVATSTWSRVITEFRYIQNTTLQQAQTRILGHKTQHTIFHIVDISAHEKPATSELLPKRLYKQFNFIKCITTRRRGPYALGRVTVANIKMYIRVYHVVVCNIDCISSTK